jgi:hypothetical protein
VDFVQDTDVEIVGNLDVAGILVKDVISDIANAAEGQDDENAANQNVTNVIKNQ